MTSSATGSAPASDLGIRLASAIVMIGVAGFAIWMGGYIFAAFVVVIAIGLIWEFWGLIARITPSRLGRLACMAAGTVYIGLPAFIFIALRGSPGVGMTVIGFTVAVVIATDVGAYFTGRAIGGPKIAPAISPSKTWSGLVGGMFLAALLAAIMLYGIGVGRNHVALPLALLIGATLAVFAQAGDFFESWLKRRAGVKDSGSLIPGHGGLFDRVDGLLPVAMCAPLVVAIAMGGL